MSCLLENKVPRFINYGQNAEQQYSIHTFCDASKDGYAAVIFLTVAETERVWVYLLAAKSRVSPLKSTSIPRLELLAATIGVRLLTVVKKNLELAMTEYFWSDSSTVLAWIRQTGRRLYGIERKRFVLLLLLNHGDTFPGV